jgi:osmoprotectant transport system permease protein
MDLVSEAVGWLIDPAHWQGGDGIPTRLLEHVVLSGGALLAAMALALPPGLVTGHTGRGGFVAIALANVGRALPSFALLVMVLPFVAPLLGLRFWPTFVALVLLAIPPILTNAYTGMRGVDPETVEAARGMGMSGSEVALRVELPIALPVVIAGIRTAAVQVVATATLGAVAAGGGLGRYIVDGFARNDDGRLIVGALLVALLALATERFFALLELKTISPGLRDRVTAGPEELAPTTADAIGAR